MKQAPEIPQDEARCEALHSLDILDTPQEERFDRLTRLAQQMFGVQIALVSLVDERRQWFKSRQGLEASETARSISFCGHAIEQAHIFVVEDTLKDERFADNPLVTDGPRIRFYAGCPLKGPGGYLMGTLCVIDSQPRQFTDTDREGLRVIAQLVESELRKADWAPAAGATLPKNCPLRSALKRIRERASSRGAAVAIAMLVGLFMLAAAAAWDRLQSRAHLDHSRREALHALGLMRGELETALNAKLHLVYGLSGQVHARNPLSQENFAAFAQQLAREVEHIRSLQLAPQGVVTYVWPYASNRAAIGHDLLADAQRRPAAERAIETRQLWLAGPLKLMQGGEALIGRLPIFLQAQNDAAETFWGFATILLDMPGLLDEVGLNNPDSPYRYAMRGRDALGRLGEVFHGDDALFRSDDMTAQVSLPAGGWELAIEPVGGWPRGWPGQGVFQIAAALLSLLVGWLVHSLMRLPANTRQTIRRAVQELEISQSRFRDAIQTLPAGFVIFDRDDKLSVCNDRYRELYALSRPRLQVGRNFEEILHYAAHIGQFAALPAGNAKALDDYVEIILQRHRMPSSAFDQQLADGRWVRVVEKRMRDGGTVSFHVDVTDQKANESALIEARERAEQANQAKSTFLATVSHEVRTPLNGVIGLLSVLSGDAELSSTQGHYVHTAHQSAQHLLALLNEILDVSKMEAGKLDLEASDFCMVQMIDGAMDLIRGQAQDKDLNLTVHIDPVLRDHVICADEARLRQIVLNLLSNAVKFTDQGAVTLEARVLELDQAQGQVGLELSVTDTGIGFDASQAERLFTPFDQLDGDAARRFSGTGLGLTICKRLVTMMGGEIHATGEPGKGACFRVLLQLPIGKPGTVVSSNKPEQIQLPADLGWRPVRVLLAEDSPTNQLVIKAMLNNTGYVVDVVGNGREAVDAMQALSYDLVLMDVFMPEMDGIQATRLIRQNFSREQVPIIALTANAMQGDRERFVEAGMNEHLTKPLERAVLLTALYRWAAPLMLMAAEN